MARLRALLPFEARQKQLPPALAALHRAMLHAFIDQGRALDRGEIEALVPAGEADDAIRQLAAVDLIVLAADGRRPTGAYPVTSDVTPHQVRAGGRVFYAMCALDALAVSPLFGVPSRITSRCAVSGEPVRISQDDRQVLEMVPGPSLHVGIVWQPCFGVAAHSLCREIVFLAGEHARTTWHAGDLVPTSVVALPEAIEIARDLFLPLLANDAPVHGA